MFQHMATEHNVKHGILMRNMHNIRADGTIGLIPIGRDIRDAGKASKRCHQ